MTTLSIILATLLVIAIVLIIVLYQNSQIDHGLIRSLNEKISGGDIRIESLIQTLNNQGLVLSEYEAELRELKGHNNTLSNENPIDFVLFGANLEGLHHSKIKSDIRAIFNLLEASSNQILINSLNSLTYSNETYLSTDVDRVTLYYHKNNRDEFIEEIEKIERHFNASIYNTNFYKNLK